MTDQNQQYTKNQITSKKFPYWILIVALIIFILVIFGLYWYNKPTKEKTASLKPQKNTTTNVNTTKTTTTTQEPEECQTPQECFSESLKTCNPGDFALMPTIDTVTMSINVSIKEQLADKCKVYFEIGKATEGNDFLKQFEGKSMDCLMPKEKWGNLDIASLTDDTPWKEICEGSLTEIMP